MKPWPIFTTDKSNSVGGCYAKVSKIKCFRKSMNVPLMKTAMVSRDVRVPRCVKDETDLFEIRLLFGCMKKKKKASTSLSRKVL